MINFWLFFFVVVFLGLHLWPMEILRLRGPIRAIAAAGLHQSQSIARSEPYLQPTPQLWQCQILNPLSGARDRTCNLMVPSQISFRCTTMGTLISDLFYYILPYCTHPVDHFDIILVFFFPQGHTHGVWKFPG